MGILLVPEVVSLTKVSSISVHSHKDTCLINRTRVPSTPWYKQQSFRQQVRVAFMKELKAYEFRNMIATFRFRIFYLAFFSVKYKS
jgi:hypothetical protein